MRGVVDRKGELFAYVIGDRLYTLDDELSGYLHADRVTDLAGEPVWRRVADGLYTLTGMEPVGFLTEDRPDLDYDY